MEQDESFIFYRSYYACILALPEKKQLPLFHGICKFGLDREETDDEDIKAFMALIKPQILANVRKRGGQIGNTNAKGGKTNKNECQTNKNEYSTNTPNVNVNITATDKGLILNKNEEEEEEKCAQGTSDNGSSNSKKGYIQGEFLVDNFIQGRWNIIAERYHHMKTVNVIGDLLREKLNDRYQYLLECYKDAADPETLAKNAMVKAIYNVSCSDWFEKNKGKSCIDWVFGSDENMMKTINGNYNDD